MQTVMKQTMVTSFLKIPSSFLFILTLILWIFGMGEFTGDVSVFLSVSLFIAGFFVSRKKHIFCSQCSVQKLYAFALHVTWEMAELSRQQSYSFHLSFGEDENWVFGKHILGWLDLFQMG